MSVPVLVLTGKHTSSARVPELYFTHAVAASCRFATPHARRLQCAPSAESQSSAHGAWDVVIRGR